MCLGVDFLWLVMVIRSSNAVSGERCCVVMKEESGVMNFCFLMHLMSK